MRRAKRRADCVCIGSASGSARPFVALGAPAPNPGAPPRLPQSSSLRSARSARPRDPRAGKPAPELRNNHP